MLTGAVNGYIDVAQLVLYAFWIFFAGLMIYLRREDKREGYPLESDRSDRADRVRVQGFPGMPAPKTFKLSDGRRVLKPAVERASRPIMARPMGGYPGAPLVPTGNPMLDGVGPAAFADRADHPDHTLEGLPMIVPMRTAPGFTVASEDPDPRGWNVYGADGEVGGTVSELWVDRSEPQIRYFEVQVSAVKKVLLPVNFTKIDAGKQRIAVRSILAAQFADVPGHSDPDLVTMREEDRIMAYYGSGNLYATPARSEPFI